MHLVFLNQYFPPDEAPTGRMLEGVAEQCAAAGNEVTILCSDASYAETRGEKKKSAYRVVRLGGLKIGSRGTLSKVTNYLLYYLQVTFHLCFVVRSPDRVVAMTTPPYLSLLARACSRLRGGDHAHWVMDLYPDVMIAHGLLKADSLPAKIFSKMTQWGFGGERNQGVLSLGPDMKRSLEKYHDATNEFIPLWATASREVASEDLARWRETRGWGASETVLMYSGNMGLGHRFREFLQAAAEEREGFRFVFSGRGKRRSEVEIFLRNHSGKKVNLLDYISHENLAVHLASADVHLVSMEPTWNGMMVPSKLQGVFGIGRPVIFVGSPESTIGQWILESEGGWVVCPDDAEAMSKALDEASIEAERTRRGNCALQFATGHFDRARNSAQSAQFFAKL